MSVYLFLRPKHLNTDKRESMNRNTTYMFPKDVLGFPLMSPTHMLQVLHETQKHSLQNHHHR